MSVLIQLWDALVHEYRTYELKLTLEELFENAPITCNVSYVIFFLKNENKMWLTVHGSPLNKEENAKTSGRFYGRWSSGH